MDAGKPGALLRRAGRTIWRWRTSAQWQGAAALLTLVVSATPLHAQSVADIDAVWRQQQLRLSVRSETTLYTCGELVQRVTAVLRAVGARDDVSVRGRCTDFAQHQLLNITLATPVEATAENVRLVTTFDPSRRLLADLRGESLPSAVDVERFRAKRKVVRLTRSPYGRLSYSDCPLLRSISEQLFPSLEVRPLKGGVRCNGEATRVPPVFNVEALVSDEAAG